MYNYTQINDRVIDGDCERNYVILKRIKKIRKGRKGKVKKTICRPYKHIFTQYKPLETKTKTRKENKRQRERK